MVLQRDYEAEIPTYLLFPWHTNLGFLGGKSALCRTKSPSVP